MKGATYHNTHFVPPRKDGTDDLASAIGGRLADATIVLLRAWLGMLLLGALAIETGWPTAISFRVALIGSALLAVARLRSGPVRKDR